MKALLAAINMWRRPAVDRPPSPNILPPPLTDLAAALLKTQPCRNAILLLAIEPVRPALQDIDPAIRRR